MPPPVIIVGPTAAGKSSLAIGVAQSHGGEIVSADAMQVYRGLDIGTAKVSAAQRRTVPHHCLDLVGPREHFSAGDFARSAHQAIDGILERGRLPIVVGGSGFYLRALTSGLAPLPMRDDTWRSVLERIEKRRGLQHLYGMLSRLDPEWATRVGSADRQRILRGLEVTLRLGEPMSAVLAREGWSGPGLSQHEDPVWVGLSWPRDLLRRRIAERVDQMIASGWVEEVERLLAAGVSPQAPALRAIGYRELVAHAQGEVSLPDARDRIVVATRQYAKRQMTWFRKQTPTRWFARKAEGEADRSAVETRIHSYLRQRLA